MRQGCYHPPGGEPAEFDLAVLFRFDVTGSGLKGDGMDSVFRVAYYVDDGQVYRPLQSVDEI